MGPIVRRHTVGSMSQNRLIGPELGLVAWLIVRIHGAGIPLGGGRDDKSGT